MYARITELGSTHRENVCGGTGEREKHVYVSKSNTVEVSMQRSFLQEQSSYFLIKYEGQW